MEAALRQLLSCVDSGRCDAASAALVRLRQACRAASGTSPAAAVEVPGERSLDRLLQQLCRAGGSGLATTTDFATSRVPSQALLALLTVPAVADAFLTEGRMAALIGALEACGGGEEGAGAGCSAGSNMRLWLLGENLAVAGSILTTRLSWQSVRSGGPVTPAQLALAGVVARPAAVRALLRAAHAQLSSELYAGDPLSVLEHALLVADCLQGRAMPASQDTPSVHSSFEAAPYDVARAAWQSADADWLCEALPPLLALRLGERRQRPGTVSGKAALRQHAALYIASRMWTVVGPLTRALSSHAAAMGEVAACICRNGDTRLARISVYILTRALEAWPCGHHGAGTALAACCKPDTLGELLRTAALRGAAGGGVGRGGPVGAAADLGLLPSLADGGCALELLSSIAAHESLSPQPSSIAAVPAAAAAMVASLRAWLEADGGRMTDEHMLRVHQVCMIVFSVVVGGGADGDAWAATLSRLGAQQLLRRAAAEIGLRKTEYRVPAAAALYAVTHAAHASCQQQQQQWQQLLQQPAQGGTTSELEEAEEKQVAVNALLDTSVYMVPHLMLMALLRPGWRPRLIQAPGILELLSATAAAPSQGDNGRNALRTLCLLAASAAPAELLPGFARAVLEVCNERMADAWAGLPSLESDSGAVAEVLACLAGCCEAGGDVGVRATLALAQLMARNLRLVQPPSQQQQQQQQQQQKEEEQQQQQQEKQDVQQPQPQQPQQQQEDKPSMQQAPSTGHAGAVRTERPHSACAVCGRTAREGAKLRRCAGCGRVTGTRYCSQECCRTDWVVRGHRTVCEAAQQGQEP